MAVCWSEGNMVFANSNGPGLGAGLWLFVLSQLSWSTARGCIFKFPG